MTTLALKAPKGSEDWQYLGEVYTNLDHSLDSDVAEKLKAGKCHAQHSAWEFCGAIWYDPGTGLYHELVNRYHRCVAHYTASDIMDVIRQAYEQWGEQ